MPRKRSAKSASKVEVKESVGEEPEEAPKVKRPKSLPRTLPCPVCHASLPTNSLEGHWRRAHVGRGQRWVCGGCDVAFAAFDPAAKHCLETGHPASGLSKSDGAEKLRRLLGAVQAAFNGEPDQSLPAAEFDPSLLDGTLHGKEKKDVKSMDGLGLASDGRSDDDSRLGLEVDDREEADEEDEDMWYEPSVEDLTSEEVPGDRTKHCPQQRRLVMKDGVTKRSLPCAVCGQVLWTQRSNQKRGIETRVMKRHVLDCRRWRFPCRACPDKLFKDTDGLKAHYRDTHQMTDANSKVAKSISREVKEKVWQETLESFPDFQPNDFKKERFFLTF